jgi:hypothetical protein
MAGEPSQARRMSVKKGRITCRAWCGHTNRAPRDETGESTKGNARGPNNRIKRASSELEIEAFRNAKSRLFKVVTRISTMPMSPWLRPKSPGCTRAQSRFSSKRGLKSFDNN